MAKRSPVRPWLAAIVKHVRLTLGGVSVSALGAVLLLFHVELPVIPAPLIAFGGLVLLFIASFLAFSEQFEKTETLEAAAHAGTIIGMLAVSPSLHSGRVSDDEGYNVLVRPMMTLENQADKALAVRVDRLRTFIKDSEGESVQEGKRPEAPTTLPPHKPLDWWSLGDTQVKPGETIEVRIDFEITYALTASPTGVRIRGAMSATADFKSRAGAVETGWTFAEEAQPEVVQLDPKVGLWAT